MSGPGRTLVAFEGVGKIFDNDVVALKRLDLDVREGEILTLLGPSGCGKSTALRLIAGLIQPSRGRIIWAAPEARRDIGFVFQEPTLLPWADAFDNVFLPLRLKGRSRRDAAPAVREALARVGLADFSAALPRELSGGMKMRCAIARALAAKPQLLLMDEPFAALDEVTRFRLNDDLLALKRELRMTVAFVTHSVFESAFLSTRILVLSARGGEVCEEILVDPELRRDAEFRSSPAFADICRRASRALRAASETQA